MPLGMEVDLSPGDFVFDGDPAPQKKGHSPIQIFGQCLLWPNGWMDEDATVSIPSANKIQNGIKLKTDKYISLL